MSVKAIKSKKPEDMVLRLMRIAEILIKEEGEESPTLPSIDVQTQYIDTPLSNGEKHKHIVLM
jgi:hypothetical protein